MRPALWIVRFAGEFPDWQTAYVGADQDETDHRPGWYGRHAGFGDLVYAASASELREAMKQREYQRYREMP